MARWRRQLSLAVRTHSGRIKLLVTRSHRPVGSRHNKSTSLLRLSGQMEQLPASAGLFCLFFPDWFRTANLLMEFFVLLHHWQEVNYPCDVCAHASERETIISPCLSLSVWELWPELVQINILRTNILWPFLYSIYFLPVSAVALISWSHFSLNLYEDEVWGLPGWCINGDVNYWENSSVRTRSVTKGPL